MRLLLIILLLAATGCSTLDQARPAEDSQPANEARETGGIKVRVVWEHDRAWAALRLDW